MLFWFLLLVLMLGLFIVDYFNNNNKLRVDMVTVFIIVILTIISGLRGTNYPDLATYTLFFENIPSLSDALFYGESYIRLEPLYQLFISIFKIFSDNHNLFLAFQTLVLFFLVIATLKRFRAPINIGLIIYFFLLYLQQFGQQRMAIAFVLCMFLSTYILRKQPVKFVVGVVLAAGFHYSTIIFILAYPINMIALSKKNIIFLVNSNLNKFQKRTRNYVDQMRTFKIITFRVLTRRTLIISVVACLVALLITEFLNIFAMLYERIFLVGGVADNNIYLHKFKRSYEANSLNQSLGIVNAWFGLLSLMLIALFVYKSRKYWLNDTNALLFVNFIAGIFFMILMYKFPMATDRVFRMYGYTALVIIFSLMSATKKKNDVILLPSIFAICIYVFLSKINGETGSYNHILSTIL